MFNNKQQQQQQQRVRGPTEPPTPPISPFNDLDMIEDSKTTRPARFLGRILNGKHSTDAVTQCTTSRSTSRATKRGPPPPTMKKGHSNGVSENTKGTPSLRTASSVDHIKSSALMASMEPNGANGIGSRKNSNTTLNGVNNNKTLPPIFTQGPLPALQTRQLRDVSDFEPVPVSDLLPDSFDLVPTGGDDGPIQSTLEQQSELLFSKFHLSIIFQDFMILRKFIGFLTTVRPSSVPLLEYYLRSVKALAALNYANSIVETLDPVTYHGQGLVFTENRAQTASSKALGDKIAAAFQVMARDDLPAFITHIWMELVEASMRRRITGSLPAHLRDLSEGLAETFCLTDPSKADNPIIFASDEFYRTTQYGTTYAIGRNCRFLQGPKTSPFAIRRIKEKCEAGQEHYETFLNYRRDGSPFMNLLMCTPLKDRSGRVRYFLGAQVDVSGLVEDLAGLDYLKKAAYGRPEAEDHTKPHDNIISTHYSTHFVDDNKPQRLTPEEGFKEFSEMLNDDELDIVRRHGGRMHHPEKDPTKHTDRRRLVIYPDDDDDNDNNSHHHHRGRDRGDHLGIRYNSNGLPVSLNDALSERMERERSPSPVSMVSSLTGHSLTSGGYLGGIYENYVLVRPAPSLRILFASPSLRIPGLLQSCLLDRIGGPPRVREKVAQAFVEGQGVTANVRWIAKPDRSHHSNSNGNGSGNGNGNNGHYGSDYSAGKPRWLHSTPLLSASRVVGVWMVVLVDDDAADVQVKRSGLQTPGSKGHGTGMSLNGF